MHATCTAVEHANGALIEDINFSDAKGADESNQGKPTGEYVDRTAIGYEGFVKCSRCDRRMIFLYILFKKKKFLMYNHIAGHVAEDCRSKFDNQGQLIPCHYCGLDNHGPMFCRNKDYFEEQNAGYNFFFFSITYDI